MSPSTGQLTILLIIIKLAESGVLGELLEHAPTAMPEGGSCIGRRMVCSEWDFASAIRAIGELKRSLRNTSPMPQLPFCSKQISRIASLSRTDKEGARSK